MDRRKFVAALGSTVAALGKGFAASAVRPAGSYQAALEAAASGQAPVSAAKTPVIGIQIGSISFLDEGTEKVLDILQEKACVNTLFLASFTYGNGIAGRQIPGHPFPDHGPQNHDDHFHGGNYATPHPSTTTGAF